MDMSIPHELGLKGVLFGECFVNQPCYYREIAAFIVCGEEDGVFFFARCLGGSHGCVDCSVLI